MILAIAAGGLAMARGAPRSLGAHGRRAEIQRLAKDGDYAEAFLLARQALDVGPTIRTCTQLWLDASLPAVSSPPTRWAPTWPSLRTGCPRLGLARPDAAYRRPRATRSHPGADLQGGFQTIEASTGIPCAASGSGSIRWTRCRRHGARGRRARSRSVRPVVPDRRLLDRPIRGDQPAVQGVRRSGRIRAADFWREPFVDGGRSVPWEEAIARFRDATGRPGPATWTAGTYPDGQADFPVGGVSWYEAAAYAAFAGKSLPTIHHWFRAANLGRFADILTVSNFSGKGPAAVGSYDGLGPFGTYDMAGNVKEWCWNETATRRFLLGGAWNEPRYCLPTTMRARRSSERRARLPARAILRPLPAAVAAPVRIEGLLGRDAPKRKPVSDDIFDVYRGCTPTTRCR